MLKFTISGEPRTKKNSQNIFRNAKTGKTFISTSKLYKEFASQCKSELKEVTSKIKEPINYPINIQCVYYRSSMRRVDLVNLQEATLDILTENGIIEDDNRNIVYSMDGSRVYYDKEEPRTEITISKIKDNEVEIWQTKKSNERKKK